MPKEPLYPHIPKSKQPLFPHAEPGTQKMKFVETRNAEGGLDRAVQFSDAQNNPLARVSFGNVNGKGIVVQEIKALGRRLTQEEFKRIIYSMEELASQNKRPVVWIQSRATDILMYQKLGYNFDKVTGTYVKHVLGGKVPVVKFEDVMFQLPQVSVEGGEEIPTQFRHLISWISEPLLPAIEPEEGERKIDVVLKNLKDGVETIQQSEKFRLFLTTMSKFHNYSIGNQILIMLQEPNATHVAGFVTWKELDRWVKRGGKGISILAPVFPPRATCPKCGARIPKGTRYCPKCGEPVEIEIEISPRFFKVVTVFDISQTEGKPLPEFEVPVLTGAVNEELFSKLMVLMKAKGVPISFESQPSLDPAIKGQYSPATGIWIRPEEPRAQQLKSLAHEIAHYYSEGVFRIPRYDAETIAESAAFVVGAHYGFDSGVRSFPYVALWARDKKVLEKNLDAIRKVVTTILEALS